MLGRALHHIQDGAPQTHLTEESIHLPHLTRLKEATKELKALEFLLLVSIILDC